MATTAAGAQGAVSANKAELIAIADAVAPVQAAMTKVLTGQPAGSAA